MDDYRLSDDDKRQESKIMLWRMFLTVALVSAAAVVMFFVWRQWGAEQVVDVLPPSEISVAPEAPVESDTSPTLAFAVGQLVETPEREAYNDGDMILSIPKINYEGPVWSMGNPDIVGEDAVNAVMDSGPGLFYCAQMPGTGNANTSIAGHRDIAGCEFYYLDQITDGDRLFLVWQGKRFTYEYAYTTISDDLNDWTPIKTQAESILTLQTCTPIGIASHRMFVVARFINTENLDGSPYSEDSSQE